MPGPGSGIPEHEFRRKDRERQESPAHPERLAAEGARVFALVHRCIQDSTAIPDEEAEALSRAVADAHTRAIRSPRK